MRPSRTHTHINTVCTGHPLKSTALCCFRSVFGAPQALSMMRNGKRSDCNALLVSSVASAQPVWKIPCLTLSSCSLCSFCLAARGHRHPAEPQIPALLLSGRMHINTLYTAYRSPAFHCSHEAGPKAARKQSAHPHLSHPPHPPHPPPAGAIPRSRRRTQGDDYLKTEKI